MDASRSHMIYQNLNFHRTHEEEQDIGLVLEEVMNSVNLDDKLEPNRHLAY